LTETMRNITHLVVHCTATPQSATVASIQRYWREVMKWKSPGYHIIVTPAGAAVRLASDTDTCNGVKGHNASSLHVSYIGGVDANGKPLDNRTPEQKATLRLVLKAWREKYPTARIQGHRDFEGVAKACPSFDARAEYAAL